MNACPCSVITGSIKQTIEIHSDELKRVVNIQLPVLQYDMAHQLAARTAVSLIHYIKVDIFSSS